MFTAWYEPSLYIESRLISVFKAVSCLRRIVAGLSPADARGQSHVSPCEIYGERSGTGTEFSPSTLFISLSISFHSIQSPSSFTYCYYRKDKRKNPGNFRISSALPVTGKHWTEKFFQFFFTQISEV